MEKRALTRENDAKMRGRAVFGGPRLEFVEPAFTPRVCQPPQQTASCGHRTGAGGGVETGVEREVERLEFARHALFRVDGGGGKARSQRQGERPFQPDAPSVEPARV